VPIVYSFLNDIDLHLGGLIIHCHTQVISSCAKHNAFIPKVDKSEHARHDYTIGTLDCCRSCDACADMGMTYSVMVQCTDCVVFTHANLT